MSGHFLLHWSDANWGAAVDLKEFICVFLGEGEAQNHGVVESCREIEHDLSDYTGDGLD